MKKETKKAIRITGIVMFLVYLCLLVYFLFFAEGYGRAGQLQQDYRYNLVPFQEIRRFWVYREQLGFFSVFSNIFGNVIGFLPFGFILPIIFAKLRKGGLITGMGFLFSLFVETVQLFTKVGCFDVDDLILNTAGAFFGYVMFAVCDAIRRRYHGKTV